MTAADAHLLARAVELAARGEGFVEPNPMVGAVVTDAAGRVVGDGWHRRFGGPHAEVHALEAAAAAARGGTLYVTLEPCCHHGKTPPCTDAVLRSGVRRVVAAMPDPFPKVAGGGFAILRAAGVEVDVGVGRADAEKLNAPYLKRVRTGRPWVIGKWAVALDGRIATRTGDSKWISGQASRRKVHELRGRVDAVIVGRGTVAADDPELTARPPGPRTAARVVLSASGELPDRRKLRTTARDVPVIVYVAAGNEGKLAGWAADGSEVVPLPAAAGPVSPAALLPPSPPVGEGRSGGAPATAGHSPDGGPLTPLPIPPPQGGRGQNRLPVADVLADLGRRGMTNVLVEGGAGVLGAFADAGQLDEVWAFIAPVVVGGDDAPPPVGGLGVGRLADALRLTDVAVERLGDDVWVRGRTPRAGERPA